jgi:predicted small lipoprotein YifL
MAATKSSRFLFVLLAAALLLGLSGCGKKGPVRPLSSEPAQEQPEQNR